MKNKIIQCALKSGASDIGFLSARTFSELLTPLKADIPFTKTSPYERINPFSIDKNAKTIIVLLFSYKTDTDGNISSYARGKDYHTVLKDISKPLIALINSLGYNASFFCDNANLNERFLAREAGLGFIGENGFLISPEFGSFVFLAHIITDLEISPDTPNKDFCMACGKCKNACPTKALSTGDFYSCLSYITQKKGELSKSEANLIKKTRMCWGCDICQKVCPHNENVPTTKIPEFSENLICNLNDIAMSNKEFKQTYSDRAFSWRGKGVIERNLNIINNPKDIY